MAKAVITGRPDWREVGNVGSLTIAVEGNCVLLGDLWALNAAQRDRFMRLWCEAERQAEATDG